MSLDLQNRVNLLSEAAQYDACLEAGQPAPSVEPRPHIPDHFRPERAVSHVNAGGRRMPVLKILQTSTCEKNCYYCAFRAGRDFRREAMSSDDLAYAFDQMVRANLVEGLFLSSAITGTAQTMDRMIATVELVRQKYAFPGYIHLKLLPSAEPAHIERAIALADRVSVNLEAPNSQRLAQLAPRKEFAHSLLETLQGAAAMIHERSAEGYAVARAGTVTQFVVGPAGESDQELLLTTDALYKARSLTRAYYSAFSPVRDTPLENVTPTSPWREHRLYQSDFLLRFYGFQAQELIYNASGNLSLTRDPKQAWATAHPERFPIEVNRAGRLQLLRIPGIGPRSADRILAARRLGMLRDLGQLGRMGVNVRRAAPYLLVAGRAAPVQLQLPLFDDDE
jgi:predicted DNA-binding helix-hairpin-helix protein